MLLVVSLMVWHWMMAVKLVASFAHETAVAQLGQVAAHIFVIGGGMHQLKMKTIASITALL